MLRNFIIDADIMKYAPNIKGQMYSGQTSYQPQIDKAFDLVLNDFQKAGYDSRLCMPHLDLLNADYDDNDVLVSVAKTADYEGDEFEMGNRRRFVIDVYAITPGSSYWTAELQGSNKAEPESGDWEDIDDSVIDNIKATGRYTVVLQSKWEWVRIKLTKSSATSITLTAFVIETVFDDLICLRALMLMLGDWRKSPDDEWDFKYKDIKEQYEAEFNKVQFYYDTNKDGAIDDDEVKITNEVTFTR